LLLNFPTTEGTFEGRNKQRGKKTRMLVAASLEGLAQGNLLNSPRNPLKRDRFLKMHAVLTGLGGEGAPASVAVADDEVPELLVLLRRPQALPVLHLGLLASLARHGLIGGAEMSRTGQGERKEALAAWSR
jgi:hypothetical protein